MCRVLLMTLAVLCFSVFATPEKSAGNEAQILGICQVMSGSVRTKTGLLHSGWNEQSQAQLSTLANKLSDTNLQSLIQQFIAAAAGESQAYKDFLQAKADLDAAELRLVLVNALPVAIDFLLDEDIDVPGLVFGLVESTIDVLQKQAIALTKLNDWLEARIAMVAAKSECIRSLQTFLIDRLPSRPLYEIDELFSFSRPIANADADFSPHEFVGIAGKPDNPTLSNIYAVVEYVCVAKSRDKNDPLAFQSKKLRDAVAGNRNGSLDQLLAIGEIGEQMERRLDLWQKYLGQPKLEIFHAGQIDQDAAVRLQLLPLPEMLSSVSAVRILVVTDEVLGLAVKEIKDDEQALLNLLARWQTRNARATAEQRASYKMQSDRVRRAASSRKKEAARFSAALSGASASLQKWKREYEAKLR